MIFVTGGTGLVGVNLLLRLTTQYAHIRALKRKNSNLNTVKDFFEKHGAGERYQQIDWVEGDLLDVTFVEEILQDVETIFHAAALVSFDNRLDDEIIATNVTATENLVNAAIEAKVNDFVFVSSIATLDDLNPLTKMLDENSAFNPNKKHSTYALSKLRAEMEVWRGSQEGLNVIVVNPSIIIGSLDGKRESERIFRNHFTNRYAPAGGSGFVDVRDVVAILLELHQKKIYNQKFILNSENVYYFDVLNRIAEKYHQKTKKVPNSLLYGIHKISQLGKPFGLPNLDRGTLKAITTLTSYDNHKIKSTLHYDFIPIDEALDYHFEHYKQLKL
ncbi:NAD-dependent epimerase/dehydratase family protein [Vaginella massiliensis]|uniref:NAD-dependent epimerase/dehydratase family protein n=1 Tax=Vaginella massiliensis TaxID=1816680 RepID=UPI003753848D